MFERITHAIVGAGGAAVATQFPAYFQQYLQRLGGARDEAIRAAEAAGSGAGTPKMSRRSEDDEHGNEIYL